jgi:nucleotide-binding universal stress UspA family protein
MHHRNDSSRYGKLLYAEEIDADLLVIMSHAENKFNQLLFGSRINKVISHSAMPVLSFRPEDEEE